MPDFEMTKLCAEAMGIEFFIPVYDPEVIAIYGREDYNPLHNDAQAMELVKRFGITINKPNSDWWHVWVPLEPYEAESQDLNRAIVECVSKMQSAKGK